MKMLLFIIIIIIIREHKNSFDNEMKVFDCVATYFLFKSFQTLLIKTFWCYTYIRDALPEEKFSL